MTNALSTRLIELSRELAAEQRWYDRAYACLAKHMARGTQESRTEATGHVKHGANLRSERAAELRTLATEAPQAICAELYRLANTLETSADNVAGDISELAAAARSNAEPEKPTATEGEKLEGNGGADDGDETDDGFRPAHKLYDLDERVGDTKRMLKFLDDHPEIPTRANGRRRMVFVAKLVDVLDATSPLNQIDENEFMAGIVKRYGDVKKGSKPQK